MNLNKHHLVPTECILDYTIVYTYINIIVCILVCASRKDMNGRCSKR